MELQIRADVQIADVQQQFAAIYPFLKLEFFRPGRGKKHGTAADTIVAHTCKLSDISRKEIRPGTISFSDHTTTTELEQALREKFGLNVQLFRKSGTIWLESVTTDHFTLRQQNEHGKEISTTPPAAEVAAEDFDLTRDADH
jgi:glycerol-3-phosphate O-acyltransferase